MPVTLDILNTARPAAPKVLYVLPTFGWSDKTEGTWSVSARGGGGLRGHISIGPGSLPARANCSASCCGAVCRRSKAPSLRSPSPTYLSAVVTQWGMDPIWDAPPPPSQAVPLPQHFRNAVEITSGLTWNGRPASATYRSRWPDMPSGYDADRQLWYCDIELDPGVAYFPFIRLALARYQPKSLPDAHLSRVVLADTRSWCRIAPRASPSTASIRRCCNWR